MSLVCEDLTQAHAIYMPNYYYMVLQKYTTYNGLREHFPEKSDHEGMDHTPWAVNSWQCWTVESTYSVDFLKPNIMRIRTRVVFSNQMSPQITWTKSNLKLRDDGGRTEAAWCRSPLIPTCMILLGKFKLQYVTVSVSTLFCHFVATLLDRLLLQDFCWIWGRLWIKRWKMIMMT